MPQPSDSSSEVGAVDLDAEPRDSVRPRRRILFTALAALAMGGVVLAGPVGWGLVAEGNARLSTPDVIGPLNRDLSDDGVEVAASLRDGLSARIDLAGTVGAVYLDGTGRNVLFLGGTRSMWARESVLDSAFGVVADIEGAAPPEPHSVDAGPFGGVMKCGHMTTGDGDVTVCGWADHGSLAMAEFVDRQESDAAALLREIRHATQTRS